MVGGLCSAHYFSAVVPAEILLSLPHQPLVTTRRCLQRLVRVSFACAWLSLAMSEEREIEFVFRYLLP